MEEMRLWRLRDSAGEASNLNTPRTRGFGLAVFCVIAIAFGALSIPSFAAAALTRPYTGTDIGGGQSLKSVTALGADPANGIFYLADGTEGALYKFDEGGTPVDFSGLGSNAITGLSFIAEADEQEIAVDADSGDLYVVTQGEGAGAIEKFAPSGQPANWAALGSPELKAPSGSEYCGVAVDAAGDVYVGDYYTGVAVYSPEGTLITTVPTTGPCHVAVGEGGTVYAGEWHGSVRTFTPSAYPPTSATTYTAAGTLAEGWVHAIYADPTGGPTVVDFGEAVAEYGSSGSYLGRFADSGAGQVKSSEAVAYGASAAVAVVGDGKAKLAKTYGQAEPRKPEVLSESVSSVGTTEVLLEATVNPSGNATTGYFEYGTEPCTGSNCLRTATVSLGSVEEEVETSQQVSGLASGTTYYFRFQASSQAGPGSGPGSTFTTSNLGAAGAEDCPNAALRSSLDRLLADCRAYELVSPAEKEGVDVRSLPDITGYPTALDQSALDGESFTFSAVGSFANPQGSPYISQYLARRAAGGWTTQNLTPPREASDQRLENEFTNFSPDLQETWLTHEGGPALAPDASGAGGTLYRLATSTGEYTPLNTTADSTFDLDSTPPIEFQGSGGGHTIFRVTVEPEGREWIFDRHDGRLDPVSVLPDGSVFPGDTTVGSNDGSPGAAPMATLASAVSEDGNVVYWTGDVHETGEQDLFARVGDRETFAVAASGPSGEARFWLASGDGSRALVSTREYGQQGHTLFEYSLGGSLHRICGELVGVVGGSEDLSTFYFISREALAAGAEPEQPNLYQERNGSLGLVTTLSPLDGEVEEGNFSLHKSLPGSPYPILHDAAVSPDGDTVVFGSRGSLTGYDNRGLVSGKPETEVYRYDATSGALDCLSCDPSGGRPEGAETFEEKPFLEGVWSAADVPAWQTALHAPRVISDGGRRVIFDGYSPILPGDVNGKEDVYEWEAPGVGTCAVAAADYSARNAGCVTLISTGRDSFQSEFLDASPSGRDIFFSTAQSLVPSDLANVDVYDAREGGGFPQPSMARPECEGEGCQLGSGASADTTPTAGSTRYSGPGNQARPKNRRPHRKKHKKKKGKRTKAGHNHRRADGRHPGDGSRRKTRTNARRAGK